MGIFSAILVSICVFIFLTYINPSTIETLKKVAEETKQKDIEERGPLSLSYEKGYSFALSPLGQAVSELGNILFWVLSSLISAAILKTKKPR